MHPAVPAAILFDEARHVAFGVGPSLKLQLPVAVDSRSVLEWKQSGWGRFDQWDNLQALRRETSPYLAAWRADLRPPGRI